MRYNRVKIRERTKEKNFPKDFERSCKYEQKSTFGG